MADDPSAGPDRSGALGAPSEAVASTRRASSGLSAPYVVLRLRGNQRVLVQLLCPEPQYCGCWEPIPAPAAGARLSAVNPVAVICRPGGTDGEPTIPSRCHLGEATELVLRCIVLRLGPAAFELASTCRLLLVAVLAVQQQGGIRRSKLSAALVSRGHSARAANQFELRTRGNRVLGQTYLALHQQAWITDAHLHSCRHALQRWGRIWS